MMSFASLQPCTLQDYPGQVAAMVFTVGCNFRCGYCHNPELVVPGQSITQENMIDEQVVLGFLTARKGLLDGLVVCGGEPTIHAQLPQFLKQVKAMGFLVKLDTNGSNPTMLAELLEKQLVDYVAMDIKAPVSSYGFCSKKDTTSSLKRSIALLQNSEISYEFRSTIVPRLHTADTIKRMGEDIAGAPLWYLQKFEHGNTLDSSFAAERAYGAFQMEELRIIAARYVQKVQVRL